MRAQRVVALCFVLCATCLSAYSQEMGAEHFSAVAYEVRNPASTMSQIDIRFKSYSSDAKAKELADLLFKNGNDALVKALEKSETIGNISLSKRVSFYDFKLVRSRPTKTGRRVIAVADRPIRFLEAYGSTRSKDYTLGLLVLNLKKNEKGEEVGDGTLMYAAKVKIKEGKRIDIEYFGQDPIKVANVKKYD